MRQIFFIVIATFLCLEISAQLKKNLEIHHMLRGYIYAASAIKDTNALGGFGKSGNLPRQIENSQGFTETGFFLKVDTTQSVTFAEKYNGYKLMLVNKSDSIVQLRASDSRLSMIAEAFVDLKWQPIEYLPSSGCGNSYHNVFLGSGEYWQFEIPKYAGKIKTRIRYKLYVGRTSFVYSNEISGSINKKQLTEKQGHTPSGIMDPYRD